MSDTSLAVRRFVTIGNYLPPPPKDELAAIIEMANYLAKVPDVLPKHFFGQPYKIMAVTLYARELGIPNFTAYQHMQVIEGKAGADAQLMATLVTRAGHKVDPCLDRKVPGKSRTCRITRGDTGVTFEVTWTIEMAVNAKLAGKDNWRNYPDSMLWARALSQCAREGCPDALMGVSYTPEEIGGVVTDGAVIDGEAVVVTAPSLSTPNPAVSAEVLQPDRASDAPKGETVPGTNEDRAADQGQGSQAPSPPSAPVLPLAGASISRRMGAGRSIGPAPRRTNVVTVDAQAAEKPATAPGAPAQAAPSAEPAPSQPAPSALTDEPVLPEPIDPGKAKFLDDLRGDLRVQTAKLYRINAIIDNVKRGLEGKEPNEVPPASPSEASDQALASRIDTDWPGRKLENLGEAELTGLMERFEASLSKKRAVLKERGVQEE
jgi:hypothetical protein